MKLKNMKNILRSTTGDIQMCVVWNSEKCVVLENACSVEYAIKHYGEYILDRIYTYELDLVISIH